MLRKAIGELIGLPPGAAPRITRPCKGTPSRDRANAADFVMSFWVGWLHARAADGSRFVLYSEDASLEQTLSDLLRGGERAMVSNPASLEEEDA